MGDSTGAEARYLWPGNNVGRKARRGVAEADSAAGVVSASATRGRRRD